MQWRSFPSMALERWPLPVVSSTRMTSPAPMTRLSPSLAVIWTPASRVMMYWRRGAGGRLWRAVGGTSRKMIPVAGRRLESLPACVSSAHSTLMSRKCDCPLASVYRLWMAMYAPRQLVSPFDSSASVWEAGPIQTWYARLTFHWALWSTQPGVWPPGIWAFLSSDNTARPRLFSVLRVRSRQDVYEHCWAYAFLGRGDTPVHRCVARTLSRFFLVRFGTRAVSN